MTKANPDIEMSVSPRRLKSHSQRTKRFQRLPPQNQFLIFLITLLTLARLITPQATRMKKESPLLMRRA